MEGGNKNKEGGNKKPRRAVKVQPVSIPNAVLSAASLK